MPEANTLALVAAGLVIALLLGIGRLVRLRY
jgi:hypothetical protein